MRQNGRPMFAQSYVKHGGASAARSTINFSGRPPSAAWSAGVWVWSRGRFHWTCCRLKNGPSSLVWTPGASRPPRRRASTLNWTACDWRPSSRRPSDEKSSTASARSPNWPSATGAKISAGTSQKTPAGWTMSSAATSLWERRERGWGGDGGRENSNGGQHVSASLSEEPKQQSGYAPARP